MTPNPATTQSDDMSLQSMGPGRRAKANALAMARIFARQPRWCGVILAADALGLADKLLLHAGPALLDPTRPPAGMMNAAILSSIHEAWAKDEAEAEHLIHSGQVQLQPTLLHRVSTPLVALVSARTPLVVLEAGDDIADIGSLSSNTSTTGSSVSRWYGFLGSGAGAQMRFGGRDPAILNRLHFRDEVLVPGFSELLAHSPIDLLAIARAGLNEGDELHSRLSAATQVLHAMFEARKINGEAAKAVLGMLLATPAYFLNLWIPSCAFMADAATGTLNSSIVTRCTGNGEKIALQLAGLPGQWFSASAPLVRGPFLPNVQATTAFPPVTGDSAIIDALGFGGQTLSRSPSLVEAFKPWIPEDDEARAQALLCDIHPVLGVAMGLDAEAVHLTGRAPMLSIGMVANEGQGLLGRGLCELPVSVFSEAVAKLTAQD